MITTLVVIIRLAEVVLDPILGNIVDNTRTKYGKFKPWLLIGTIVSAILLVVCLRGFLDYQRLIGYCSQLPLSSFSLPWIFSIHLVMWPIGGWCQPFLKTVKSEVFSQF